MKKIEQSYINNNLEDKKDIKIEKLGKIINEKASLFFKISDKLCPLRMNSFIWLIGRDSNLGLIAATSDF